MKLLILVRHAKSSWKNPNLDDHDRPLNSRGLKNAPEMGQRLKEAGWQPQIIATSTALRALKTARLIAAELEFPLTAIRQETALYHASVGTWTRKVQQLDPKAEQALLVGHNPGISEFCQWLCPDATQLADMPTAAVAVFELACEQWRDLTPGCARLVHFDTPKKQQTTQEEE